MQLAIEEALLKKKITWYIDGNQSASYEAEKSKKC